MQASVSFQGTRNFGYILVFYWWRWYRVVTRVVIVTVSDFRELAVQIIFYSYNNLMRLLLYIIISILYMRRLRHIEIK